MSTKTIYARRIAGDRYDVTYSWDRTASDLEVPMAYIERAARKEHAIIEIDRTRCQGVGEPKTETIRTFL